MLFAHYPATPGSVRACADDLFAGSSQVWGVRSAVTSRHANAVSAVDGLLQAPLVSALAPVAELVGTVSAAAGVAGGALNLFADAVATYDAGIDRLNLEYESARAVSFHVGPVTGSPGEELSATQRQHLYDSRVSGAKTALESLLGLREARLRADLDEAAAATAAVLHRGLGADSVRFLATNNAFPTTAGLIFSGFGSDDHTVPWAPGPIEAEVDLSEGIDLSDGDDEDDDDGFFPNWMHDAAGGVKDAGEWTWDHKGDIGHGALDVGGLVPGFGEVADGVNGLWYLAEGNKADAALSAASMVPFAGWGSVIAKRGDDVADLFKGADDVPVPKEQPTLAANKKTGDDARDRIRDKYHPDAKIEQAEQTPFGSRRIDILTEDLTAIESKLGRTSLTDVTRRQIHKDRWLLDNKRVDDVEWVFSRSDKTGKVGPTEPLEEYLRQMKIEWRSEP